MTKWISLEALSRFLRDCKSVFVTKKEWANGFPWRAQVGPDKDSGYIAIRLTYGKGCILSIDSVGDNSFHGVLNISSVQDITAASFVGAGGVDTDEEVVMGRDDNEAPSLWVSFKYTSDQPVIITCLAGTAPVLAQSVDVSPIVDVSDSLPWTELGAGGGKSDMFVAVEGATSVAEILAAVAANKLPVCLHNGVWYVYAYDDDSTIYFTCTIQNLAKYIRVPKNGDVWYYGQIAIENTANKVTTISGNEDNTTKYPCTKAVYDFIPTSVVDTSAADLEIADENGNVIVSFNEGHIKTRLFDSRDAQEKLVSEENIKSINGSSLLGSGPLKISDTQKTSLKILFLGNSFSMDTCSYVPWVMANTNPGVEVKLGCLYIAGASLSDHVSNIQNRSASYTYYSFFGSGPYDVADDKWSESANASANSILAAETWDYIVLQQKSINSGNYNTIDGTLDTLVGLIREICGDNIKFGWLLTQAYTDAYLSSLGTKPVDADGTSLDTSKKMYEAIASVAHDVCENYGIDFLIPTGTAIQNARLTSLGSLGSSGGLTADGYHLQEGLPCLIGAYSMVMAILRNANFSETTVMLSPFRLDDAWDDAYTPTDQHNGTVVGINDDNCLIAQKCAVRALYSPFEVKRIR